MDEDQQIENEKDNEDVVSQKEINKEQHDLSTCEINCDSPGSALQSINSVNNNCADVCCSSDTTPFQPFNKEVLKEMTSGGCKFNSTWFKLYLWLTLCKTKKKVYCIYCRSAAKHDLLSFSKNASFAFIKDGYGNWKKAIERFSGHETSLTHKEVKFRSSSLFKPSIADHLNTHSTCSFRFFTKTGPCITRSSRGRKISTSTFISVV